MSQTITMFSPSKIHKETAPDIPFQSWLKEAEDIYERGIKNGEISKNISFRYWLHNLYNSNILNADGNVLDSLSSLFRKTTDKMLGTEEPEVNDTVTTMPLKSNTILGLRKPVFYTVTGLVVLSIGTYVFIKYKQYKSHE